MIHNKIVEMLNEQLKTTAQQRAASSVLLNNFAGAKKEEKKEEKKEVSQMELMKEALEKMQAEQNKPKTPEELQKEKEAEEKAAKEARQNSILWGTIGGVALAALVLFKVLHRKWAVCEQTLDSVFATTWNARMWRCSLIWLMVMMMYITNRTRNRQKQSGTRTLLDTRWNIWLTVTITSGSISLKRYVSFRLHRCAMLTRIERKAKVSPTKTRMTLLSNTYRSRRGSASPSNPRSSGSSRRRRSLSGERSAEGTTLCPGSCCLASPRGWEKGG